MDSMLSEGLDLLQTFPDSKTTRVDVESTYSWCRKARYRFEIGPSSIANWLEAAHTASVTSRKTPDTDTFFIFKSPQIIESDK